MIERIASFALVICAIYHYHHSLNCVHLSWACKLKGCVFSPVETGSYVVEIGAVDRESNALLAQTQLEIRVIGGAEPEKKMFSQSFFTRTLDRGS